MGPVSYRLKDEKRRVNPKLYSQIFKEGELADWLIRDEKKKKKKVYRLLKVVTWLLTPLVRLKVREVGETLHNWAGKK